MDAEVIVVGGGPAGSATAALLARAGRDVLLLDREVFPRDKACAEYLSPATADVLGRLGALSAVERLRPERPVGMRLIVGQRGGQRGGALVRYPDGDTIRRALCLPRRDLDAALLAHAGQCGASVLEGHQVTAVEAGPDGSTVTARPIDAPPGQTRAFSARVVIGADGARSAAARYLGVARRAVWPRRVGLIARYEGAAAASRLCEQGEMHAGRGVYCGLAPLPGGRVNAGMVLESHAVAHAGGAEAAFAQGLRQLPGAAESLAGGRQIGRLRGAAPLAHRVARPCGAGFLLVGDAAGFLDPFTGEGVFRALRGAELAAEVLLEALHLPTLTGECLSHYAALRRAEFTTKEALCYLIQGFLAWPPLLAYVLRRLERRPRPGAVLGAVLGDYRPAGDVLTPAFLWSLLHP